MDIQRINTYNDNQFSKAVLLQHGCFLVDGKPYEVEIISDYEAIIRGENQAVIQRLLENFASILRILHSSMTKMGRRLWSIHGYPY